jgi:hypothetical protein
MKKQIVFVLVAMMIFTVPVFGGWGSTVNVLDGTINGQSISSDNPEFTLEVGQIISGSFRVGAQSNYPGGPIVPMATTPNWGDPQTSYWEIAPHVSPGYHEYTINVSLTAPSIEGTYYIVTTMSGVYNSAQLMAGTHAGTPATWGTGYEVALQSPSVFEEAILYGKVGKDSPRNDPTASCFLLYSNEGLMPISEERAMSAIRVLAVPEPATLLLLSLGGLALRLRSGQVLQKRRV